MTRIAPTAWRSARLRSRHLAVNVAARADAVVRDCAPGTASPGVPAEELRGADMAPDAG